MAKETKLTTASVLAFERKLDTSDGLFFSGRWDDLDNGRKWPGIEIREKSVRGTISNRMKKGAIDPAKLDAEIQKPNLQTVDVANLPGEADTLRLHFTVKVLPGTGSPSACNNSSYRKKLEQVVGAYKKDIGFKELASRYAVNLANGRFLWRNRMGAEQIKVIVRLLKEGEVKQEWKFNSFNYSLRGFQDATRSKCSELAETIKGGLVGRQLVLLEVVAYARMGGGQEVYPSQELVLDKGSAKGGKSKTLYKVNDVAAMHSQKVGNALRTIDTWYPKTDGEDLGPIAVEPYGSVTSQGKAYRQPKEKQDFYQLLDGWVLQDKVPEKEQQHFVMATLIRGGVFGAAEK